MENTSTEPVATAVLSWELFEAMEENEYAMAHTIKTQDMDIKTSKKFIVPIIKSLPFDNFLSCSQVAKE